MSKGEPVDREIALEVANHVVTKIRPYSQLVEICGSLRRGKEAVKDIDIVALPKTFDIGDPFLIQLEALGFDGNVRWENTLPTRDGKSLKVEVNLAKCLEEFGAQLLHHTGPYQFNILLRGIAKQKGWKLSQYGLFDLTSGARIAGESESEVLKTLGLRMIYPRERDDVDLRTFKRAQGSVD